jgi:DNA-binding response OmpR family regulator
MRHSAGEVVVRYGVLLKDMHILLVEDEPIIALDLETAVRDQLGIVVGPIGNLAEALRVAQTARLDGAILDLRLRHELALPVAEALRARNIPLLIHSGQADITLPVQWSEIPSVGKPAAADYVIQVLAGLVHARRN